MRNTQYTCDRCGKDEVKDVEDHLWNWTHFEIDETTKLYSEEFDSMDFCKSCSVDFQYWLFRERFDETEFNNFDAFHKARSDE